MIDITSFVCALVTLATLLIATKVIPYIKLKVGEAHWNEIVFWAGIAVSAAEKKFKGSGRGAEKKESVRKFLNEMGFDVDLEAVDNIIESEVQKLTN